MMKNLKRSAATGSLCYLQDLPSRSKTQATQLILSAENSLGGARAFSIAAPIHREQAIVAAAAMLILNVDRGHMQDGSEWCNQLIRDAYQISTEVNEFLR